MSSSLFQVGSYLFNLYALPHFLAALFLLILVVSILISEKGSNLGWLFALNASSVGVWLLLTSLVMSSRDPDVAEIWSHVLFFDVCFIPFSILLYVSTITNNFDENRLYLFLSFMLSAFSASLVIVSDRVVIDIYRYSWGYYPKWGLYSLFYVVHLSGVLLWSLGMLWEQWDQAQTEERKSRFGLIFFAFLAGGFAVVDIPQTVGYDIFPMGFLPIIGFCSVLSYVIVRYRTADFSPAYAATEMMSTMDDPLIVCDLHGTIQFVNESCTRVLEFPEEELVGSSIEKLLASSELGSSKTQALKEGNVPAEQEFLFRSRDGEEVDVKLSVSRLTDAEDRQVGIVMIARDIRPEKQAQEQIEKLAYYNETTNLPNRRYLYEEYSDLVKYVEDGTGALFYLSISDFNEIRHSLGPQKTDTLLELLAERLQGISLDTAELVNWNTQDFVLLDLEVEDAEEAFSLAEKWIRSLDKAFEIGSRAFTLRPNIGIALRSTHGDELDELVTKADLAREEARKEAGKNVRIYETGIREKTNRRIEIKNELRKAIQNNELSLRYHPILPVKSGRPIHLEALLRWQHPEFGPIAPPKIIRMTEELGLISDLGHWIIMRGCKDLAEIHQSLDDSFKLSLNLSASQLQQQTPLLDSIDEHIVAYEVTPDDLIFEITESTAMQDVEFSRSILTEIKDRGCSVAVDDFGTGHSSIQYLMDLPIEIVKIDKSFILNLFENEENQILVETILFMAHQLDFDVVAEGVETEEQKNFLVEHNCDFLQGFRWTEPLEREQCVNFLEDPPRLS